MPWTKEERREYNKKYREANKEKIKEYDKKYKQENKDKINKYKQENKEKTKIYKQEWYKKNRKKILSRREKYVNTENGKKKEIISVWKKRDMICEDWDSMYEIYLHTWNCEYCNKEFIDSYDRCLDHIHATGEIRAILCRECNLKDVLA